MSLIAYTADAGHTSESGSLFSALLHALAERFPETLVLAACRQAPAETPPHPSRDWVRIGSVVRPASTSRLLGAIVETHQSEAVVQVIEPGTTALPSAGYWSPNMDLLVSRQDELPGVLEQLESLLPVSLFLGPGDDAHDWKKLLGQRFRAPRIEIYWTGGLVPELLQMCALLLQVDSRPMRLQLGLNELVRGAARRVLLSIPKEIELRVVAEDEFSRGAAVGAQAVLKRLRREQPRARR
jgi:hypothetical protein